MSVKMDVSTEMTFQAFPKIARLCRDVIVTEKIDGTNASIWIDGVGTVRAASRNRFITTEDDNFGFARWVRDNEDELRRLGPGSHFGEWWGKGIQRGYGVPDKRFSLFNVSRWLDDAARPACCRVVPIMYQGPMTQFMGGLNHVLADLASAGSLAAPGFMQPEGIVVFHASANVLFKRTLDGDGHKGAS